MLLAFVGYNAFLFTESVTFCGRHLPHGHGARVHGLPALAARPGALRGLPRGRGRRLVREVQAVRPLPGLRRPFHSYETPIPTPVQNLRPARETCEECHWPQKFYGAQLLQIPHFRYDEKNTRDQISLLVKTGGGSSKLGRSAGIHWHMIIDNTDLLRRPRRRSCQEIPWVKVKGADGQETEYYGPRTSRSRPRTAGQAHPPRHGLHGLPQPAHAHLLPPDRAIDLAMNNGNIAPDLPWIKKIAAEALTASYPDNATATKAIRDRDVRLLLEELPAGL